VVRHPSCPSDQARTPASSPSGRMDFHEGVVQRVELFKNSSCQLSSFPHIPTRAYLSVLTFRSPSVVKGRSPRLKFATIQVSTINFPYQGSKELCVQRTVSFLPRSTSAKSCSKPDRKCSPLEQQHGKYDAKRKSQAGPYHQRRKRSIPLQTTR
jgi:hypothetical protein